MGGHVPERSPEATRIARLSEVGRYALGVTWGDGHESILPHRALRAACPCDVCAGATAAKIEAASASRVEVLGAQSIFIGWADGHETILLLGELRDLCRCARCAGEPDYPVSGR